MHCEYCRKIVLIYYYDFKYYFWTPLKQDKIQFLNIMQLF